MRSQFSWWKSIFFIADNKDWSSSDDKIFGNDGNDKIYGELGDDSLDGGEGNDNIKGEGGDDKLLGDEGDDKLAGGRGNDELEADDGNDKMKVGKGTDTFICDLADTITYLNSAEGDEKIGPGRVIDESSPTENFSLLY